MITPVNFSSVNSNLKAQNSITPSAKTQAGQATSEENLKYLNTYYMPKINFKGIEHKEEIKQLLDNKEYEFKMPDSEEKFKGTVKDYIQNCIVRIDPEREAGHLLHGTTTEARENILQNGFDPDKISRTICGPGISSTGSEHEAIQIGGGAVLKFKFSGTCATTKHKFYENILYNTELLNDIDKITGGALEQANADGFNYDKYNAASSAIHKDLGVYVRDVLINELGIDSGFDTGSRCIPPCFVVYNTDKIYDIEKYN